MTTTYHESDVHYSLCIDLFLELCRRVLDLYIRLCHDDLDRLVRLYGLDYDRDRCLVRYLQKLVLIARRTEVG